MKPHLDRNIYLELLENGYPKSDMDHHESDLYVYVTPLTTRLINEIYPDKTTRQIFVHQFISQTDHKPMYEIVFAYLPYWQKKINQGKENKT